MVTHAKRFLQRLDSYGRAFNRLDELVNFMTGNSLFTPDEMGLNSDIVTEALIKRFEFTQELSWNLLKDFLQYQGITELMGSRDVYRKALSYNLISDNEWFDMIMDRNLSAHDYNDSKAKKIAERIINVYHPLLKRLKLDMTIKASEIPAKDI